jgi:cell wall-associated NlpC family hydrolase
MAGVATGVVPANVMTGTGRGVRIVVTLVCLLASVPAVVAAGAPSAHAAETKASTQAAPARRVSIRTRAVRLAASRAGSPYRYGAAGPSAFDCSGLVTWVYNRKLGRHLPRTSAAQYGASRHIRKRDIRRGDLVFFSSGGSVYHVGIYAGRHRIWHAPYSGTRVRRERIWTTSWRAGRVLR